MITERRRAIIHSKSTLLRRFVRVVLLSDNVNSNLKRNFRLKAEDGSWCLEVKSESRAMIELVDGFLHGPVTDQAIV